MPKGFEKKTMAKPPKARQVFCKNYSSCLNGCLERDDQSFDCEGCLDFEIEKAPISAKEFFSECLLLAKLYLPKAYQAYQDYAMREREMKKGGSKNDANS